MFQVSDIRCGYISQKEKFPITATNGTTDVCKVLSKFCLKIMPACNLMLPLKNWEGFALKSASHEQMEPWLNLNHTHGLFCFSERLWIFISDVIKCCLLSRHYSISDLCTLTLNHLFYLKAHILQLREIFSYFPFGGSLPYFCIFPFSFFLGLEKEGRC